MVMARQPKQVLSWQVPLAVDNETATTYFFNTSRTLCYDEIAVMGINNYFFFYDSNNNKKKHYF